MIAKFAIIAKITVHSEILNFRYACISFAMIAKFIVHSENFHPCFCDPNDYVLGFSHFYPHCNYSTLVILVFHMFVRLYKPF